MKLRKGSQDATGLTFGIVASKFNKFVTSRLLTECVKALAKAGATDEVIEVVRVPGAFEIPLVARQLARWPTGRSALAEFCCVDLVYTMYCEKAGLPLPEHRLRQRFVGGKWIDDLSDTRSAYYRWRRGELTLRQWLRSRRGPKWHAIWSLRDPLPFVLELARFLWRRGQASLERPAPEAPGPRPEADGADRGPR